MEWYEIVILGVIATVIREIGQRILLVKIGERESILDLRFRRSVELDDSLIPVQFPVVIKAAPSSKNRTMEQISVCAAGASANILSSILVAWMAAFMFFISAPLNSVDGHLFGVQSMVVTFLLIGYVCYTNLFSIFFVLFTWLLSIILIVKLFVLGGGIANFFLQNAEQLVFGHSELKLQHGYGLCMLFIFASFMMAMVSVLPIPGLSGGQILRGLKNLLSKRRKNQYI